MKLELSWGWTSANCVSQGQLVNLQIGARDVGLDSHPESNRLPLEA